MARINSRVILPAVTGAVGALWVIAGLVNYGWWTDGRPTSGFFPVLVGGVLLLVSVFAVIREVRLTPPSYNLYDLYPLLAAVAVVLLALLIGFFPALTLYVLLWLKVFEKYRWLFSVLTTAVTAGAMYAIFALWLRVPFPQGLILDMVLR